METILVLTDFSKKAENAALYALRLAEKTHAKIILFHLYDYFHSPNLPDPDPKSKDRYNVVRNESLLELNKIKQYLETHSKQAEFKPDITILNNFGLDLASSVRELVMENKVDLIIMGSKGDNAVSHLFYGSDAYGVLDNAGCPILFVPITCSFDPVETIVFANDLKKDYNKAINFLTYIARIDNSHIILTHFGEYDGKAARCLNLIKQASEYVNVTSRLFPLKDIGKQLKEFSVSVGADLVVMIHHRGASFEKFISGSKSKRLIDHNRTPLLILPD